MVALRWLTECVRCEVEQTSNEPNPAWSDHAIMRVVVRIVKSNHAVVAEHTQKAEKRKQIRSHPVRNELKQVKKTPYDEFGTINPIVSYSSYLPWQPSSSKDGEHSSPADLCPATSTTESTDAIKKVTFTSDASFSPCFNLPCSDRNRPELPSTGTS